jgi:thiol-disulfide isomerase/thioredoxin
MRQPRCLRSNSRRLAATFLLALCAGFAQAAEPEAADTTASPTASLDAALVAAKARHAPVLIDFYAPWCYSCYYMAKNVKNGAEWEALEKTAVVLELDADAPDGAHWMKQWTVKGLPSYVVLNENGEELGRIPLEQTRPEFYKKINAIIAHGSPIEALKAKVKDGSPASIAATREVLAAYAARRDGDGGLAWRDAQPDAVKTALDKNPQGKLWIARLKLLSAANAKRPEDAAAIAPEVFAGDLGCERAYEVERALDATESLPADQRKKLFAPEKPKFDTLLKTRVFIAKPTCADARSEVETAVELDKALGDDKAAVDVLDRAIADSRKKIGDDLKKNRNLADNLRVYLDIAGKTDELDALYPQLIAAYPDDYVYAFRFGRSLAARGQYDKALGYLEQAAPKAYGANRLQVAQLRAEVLVKLNRATDAKQVAADALKANGPFFPEQAAKLKATVSSS